MGQMFKGTASVAAALAACLALGGAAVAQEEENGAEVVTREVTVTATRTEKDLMEVPMSVGVVSGEDLKREPAANVADALSGMPGVSIADGGMPGGKRVMIRGESPMRSLILIDGVKISEQKSMSGSAIMIDASQIERIEVVKGPASVLYGSEAIGGVVNIITKKGGDKPVSFSQQFVADSSTESVDIQSAVFGAYNGFNYRFTGSGVNAGQRKTPGGTLEKSEYDNRYYSGQLGYDWDGGSFFVKADRYESEISIPDNVTTGLSYSGGWVDASTSVLLNLPRWDRESVSAGLELDNLTSNLIKLKFNAYYQNMKKNFENQVISDINNGATVVNMDIHTFNDQDSYGGSVQSEWRLGNNYLIAGLDYNKDELQAWSSTYGTNSALPPFMPGAPVMTDKITKSDSEQGTLGVFIQNEWAPNDDWALTLGLRQTWIESKMNRQVDDQRALLPPGPRITVSPSQKTTDSNLVGNIGLVYSGFDDWALRAGWSQGYRFPSLNQLYLGTSHGSTSVTEANPDLDPEESNNFEIGARYNGGNWNLDLAFFYNDAKNYISTKKINNQLYRFDNMDKARTFGVELGLDYTFEEYGLTPYLNAAWINRRIENTIEASRIDAGGNTVKEVIKYKTSDTQTAPFQGRVGLKWEGQASDTQTVFTDFYVNWASSSKYYYYDDTYGHNHNGDFNYGFTTEKKGGWQTLNMTVGTQWGEEHKWNASLSLRNITDKAYTLADSMVQDPGFHVVLGVGFEY
ncbi:TonB-dependent receptor [Deltaproteobacteria bacterium OttesenSCG-928-K17]|nr:TonB-dependent receptor [Deltaproteobacteria bacterium OttesenSCG-928-K17]